MKKLIKLTGMSVASMAILTTGLMAEEPEKAEKQMEKKAEEMTLVSIADGNKDFTTLVAAIKAAGLVEALNEEGPFTIFAPNNEAFEKLPEGTLEDLLKPENKEKLTAILKYHIVPTKVMSADVKPMKIATLEGHEFEVKMEGGKVMVNDAKVIKTDIVGKNGVIHVIDTVIMPPVEDEE